MNGPLTNQFLINRDSEGFGFVIGLRMNRENRHHFEVAPLSPNIGRQRKKKRRRRRASPTPPAGAGVSFPASGPSGSVATSIRPDYRGRDFLFRLLFFFSFACPEDDDGDNRRRFGWRRARPEIRQWRRVGGQLVLPHFQISDKFVWAKSYWLGLV